MRPTRIASPARVHSAAAARRAPHTATPERAAMTTRTGAHEERRDRKEREEKPVGFAALASVAFVGTDMASAVLTLATRAPLTSTAAHGFRSPYSTMTRVIQ